MTYLGMIGGPQFLLLLIVPSLIVTLIALVDILRNNFKGNNKIVWLFLVIFFNFFGAILYFINGKNHKIK